MTFSCSADAQHGAPHASAPQTLHSATIAKANELVNELMVERKIPGMSVTVGIDGVIIWTEGFGYADVENRVAVTPLTKFRIGSVSKTLSASALALLFKPGTKYSYSSYGWNLLSAVVEGASGEAFLPFMYQNVFWPLGMMNTVADHTDSLISYRTRFYARDQNGNLLNAPYVDNSYKWAGGGSVGGTAFMIVYPEYRFGCRYAFQYVRREIWRPAAKAGGVVYGIAVRDQGSKVMGCKFQK